MAKKKRSKKRTTRRVVRRKGSSSTLSKTKNKITLIGNNLLLFIALTLVSFVLYNFLGNDLLRNLFYVMAMVFGFVSVAFLITFLILIIMKFVSKKRR